MRMAPQGTSLLVWVALHLVLGAPDIPVYGHMYCSCICICYVSSLGLLLTRSRDATALLLNNLSTWPPIRRAGRVVEQETPGHWKMLEDARASWRHDGTYHPHLKLLLPPRLAHPPKCHPPRKHPHPVRLLNPRMIRPQHRCRQPLRPSNPLASSTLSSKPSSK